MRHPNRKKQLLDLLARDPFNGASKEALVNAGFAGSFIRELAIAGLIEPFDKTYSNPAGLKVTCYRITATGKLARMTEPSRR